jgi:type IV pilus assembly protein PilO
MPNRGQPVNNAIHKFSEMAWSKVVFIAIVVAALFYLLGADKGITEQEFANAENQRKQAEVSLKKTKEAMADLKKFRSQIDDMNTQFSQLTTYMTAAPNFADFVLSLQKLAMQSGAIVRKVSPSNKVDKIDFYETSRVDLILEGKYSQLLSFLSEISKMRRLVTIDDLDLTQAQGGDMKSGRINFKAVMVAYRYAPPPPVTAAGAPAAPGAAHAN